MTDANLCASVLPEETDSPEWKSTREQFIAIGKRRQVDDPEAWAELQMRKHYDAADLRALGRCRDCGESITLRSTGKCVVSYPCGHYRAQGELTTIVSHLEKRRRALSMDRRHSLLALIEVQP